MIGNAVPVNLAYEVACSIRDHLEGKVANREVNLRLWDMEEAGV
jgi:hypothetical protein